MDSEADIVQPGDKGLPDDLVGRALTDLIGRSVDDGTFPSPTVIVRQEALNHNIATMAQFCRDHGVELAPHGKTTMSEGLFQRQLAAGAWGITVAHAAQGRAAAAMGVERILLANQVVDPAGLAWLITCASTADVLIFVDSESGLERLQKAVADSADKPARPIQVLVEVGAVGARTGFRQADQALDVARRIAGSADLVLAGVAGYEGVIEAGDAMNRYLHQLTDLFDQLAELKLFDPGAITGGRPILTAGGSAYFDRVVDVLGSCRDRHPDLSPAVVLRSGCYVTHDHGMYARLSPTKLQPPLQPALEVRAVVQSRPDPTLALVNVGRRDVSEDVGLPVVLPPNPGHWTFHRLMDQHGFMSVDPDDDIVIGQPVALGISHPCTTFDKWRIMPVVDSNGIVVDVLTTSF